MNAIFNSILKSKNPKNPQNAIKNYLKSKVVKKCKIKCLILIQAYVKRNIYNKTSIAQ